MIVANRLQTIAVLRREPHRDVELTIGFQERGGHCPSQRRLHDRVHVAHIHAVARRFFAIDPDVEIRLPQDPEDAEVGDPPDLGHLPHRLLGEAFQDREIGADDLDGVGAFDPGQPFLDVVLDVLREVESDPDEFVRELLLQFFNQLFLCPSGRPLLERLERHEELCVEEARGVAAVIRASVLGDDGDHFRVLEQHRADLIHHRHAGFQ